jgi:hypothetical protein
MVIRLVMDQPQKDMLDVAVLLNRAVSTTCGTHAAGVPGQEAAIWRCDLVGAPEAVAFWIGDATLSVEAGGVKSLLVLFPACWGGHNFLHAKRAWTAPAFLRQGLARSLMRVACEDATLISDYEGMTAAAYALWNSDPGLGPRWWDDSEKRYVASEDVPVEDNFDVYEQARRWFLVLGPKSHQP